MKKLKNSVVSALFILTLVSCGGGGENEPDLVTALFADVSTNPETRSIELLSFKAPCFGVIQRLCFQLPENLNFHGPIEGFDFVWGHAYELSLNVSAVENPEADASSTKFELNEIISESEDSVGSRYEYERVELLDFTFTKESGVYHLLGQPFLCRAGADCDGLISINNSGGLVNVEFEYLGDGQIALVQWN